MLTTINLKQKTEVVKPFFGFYFGLYFLEDVQQPLLFCLCSCAFLRGSNEVIPPNRLYGPKDFFAGPFLICGDGGEDLISLTDSQITKYEKKYHSPLIFMELYPKPITLKCTPELYAKCMGEEH